MYLAIIIYKSESLGHDLRMVAGLENFWPSGSGCTVLQNGKSCHQVAAQMHVSYSTVQRLYSYVKYSLPKHLVGTQGSS